MKTYYYETQYPNYLMHYGVKGMKWGVRRYQNEDGSYTSAGRKHSKTSSSVNKDYTSKQRKRDRAFYGARGEKRINKKLNEGHGLQGARHYEIERRERKEKAKKTVKKGLKKTRKILYSVGSFYITDQIFNNGAGTEAAKDLGKRAARRTITVIGKMRGHDITWL